MIAILDYRAGNLTSVERALRHLGLPCEITASHDRIREAQRIIFPGVGAAGKAMQDLKDLGLDALLRERFNAGIPILGICVGLQVLFQYSQENDTRCLGLLPGRVVRFPSQLCTDGGVPLKIPHMGWNAVSFLRDHPVFRDVSPSSEFYFVHSYYPEPENREHTVGITEYALSFTSAAAYRNLVAVQFHPEKSGPPGLRILANFHQWDGRYSE
ncbi:MAG: imidazole glycerol phosphate synthase subunit HisH [Deltaproteobacteria bacterium]|nr:imidazole glycerol phosphate synthase subunit HisH [Deltaproteobacteria bacterium]